jgi:hypothetical protein
MAAFDIVRYEEPTKMRWKEAVVAQFKILSLNFPGREQVSQDRPSPGRDFNPGPPEYEAGVLTTRPQLSVLNFRDYVMKIFQRGMS